MVCRPTSSDLEHTERTSNNALTTCHFWSDVLTCSVVVCAERREQSPTTSTCVTYIYKYISKPHCVVSVRPHCPAKWHAQARMLSRALPMDVAYVSSEVIFASMLLSCCKSGSAVLQFVSHGVCALSPGST